MTPEDISQIETSLGIRLPDAYRRAVQPFPIPACAGNHDRELWDDPERLIAYNRELRAGAPGGVKPWPEHFFAIGRDAAGSSQAIDLRTGELWWADHSHLDRAGSYRHTESFAAWAADYLAGLREDLEGEGIDPGGTPERRAAAEEQSARESSRVGLGCLAVLLVGLAAVLITLWLRAHR